MFEDILTSGTLVAHFCDHQRAETFQPLLNLEDHYSDYKQYAGDNRQDIV